MSFFGAVRLLIAAKPDPPAPAGDGVPREIARGAWARWAIDAGEGAHHAQLGDACRTRVGREGRIVEILERGRLVLVCQES